MSKAAAAVAPPLVPVESPVPGVNLTLATLLVEAIKRRRKQLSSLTKHNQDDTSLQNIGNKATDATTAFLNELRNQTESSRRQKDNNKSSANAPINSIKFLLDVLSNDTNSLHLRRSSLALIREILLRSSDARAYVADGDTLLQFVSIVESVEDVGDDCVSGGRGGINETRLSPAALFQQESIEFMQQLAFRYGQLYPKFTVASRLLGDRVSSQHVQIDSHNIGTGTNEDGRRNSQRQNIHLFRRKRDEALEYGFKACRSVERLICRAENCFKVLIPRWGGFNTVDNSDANEQLEGKIRSDDSLANASSGNQIPDDASVDLEDDDSIEWEEGDDDGLLPDEEAVGDNINSAKDLDSSHVGAVAQTLAVMERSGTLLDGKLSVQVGKPVANGSSETEAIAVDTQEGDAKADARLELEAIVKKISSKRIKRLSQWIHALTYADGLMERAVADPASGNVGKGGPISVVLLPKEARETKSLLLPQMMKLKAELDSILKSADVLGVSHSESDEGREREDNVQGTVAAQSNVGVSNRATADRKRPWLSGTFTQGYQMAKKQKQSKNSKVRVIYRRK